MLEHLQAIVDSNVIDDVYIDLDGVTADFMSACLASGLEPDEFKHRPGSYLWLKPFPDALKAIELLRTAFPQRVWFLTKPPKGSPYAYGEKALWVQEHLGDEGLDHLIITQHKGKVGSTRSVLIDDRSHKGGVGEFRGTFIHFDSFPSQDFAARFELQPETPIGWGETLLIMNKLVGHGAHRD